MIKIDFINSTYECPFCKREQAFSYDNSERKPVGYRYDSSRRPDRYEYADMNIYHIKCNNQSCQKIAVIAKSQNGNKQWDLIPENVYTEYPE